MNYSFRKLYKYTCKTCKKERQTVGEKKAKKGECTKCLNSYINPNQRNIFELLT